MTAPVLAALQAAPLPAEAPIGGVVWTVVIPALLLAFATGATVMLYRHFAGQDSEEPPPACPPDRLTA